jgi:DNA polymerase-1
MPDILLALDGNSLMHRAYWALPQMHSADGTPTNAVYGFFTMLFRIVDEYRPTHIAVAFDMKEKTFRHSQYAEYKAGRRKTPDDLNEQFAVIKDALDILGIKYLECEGYEADDIIGTLASQTDTQTYIFTGDRDELQLISDSTSVVLTKKGVTETKLMTPQSLLDELGLAPAQITDLKGLMGDASDNIPGVAGVGEKTALKLLAEYHTVENLYANIDALPQNKLREKLENGKDSAFMSKQLATIVLDVPVKETMNGLAFHGFDKIPMEAVCRKYSFRNFMKRFDMDVTDAPVKEIARAKLAPDELVIFEDAAEFAFILDGEGFKFAIDEQTEYILPVKQTLLDEGYDLTEITAAVRPYFHDRRVIAHDVKAYMRQLAPYDIAITDYFDVMVADWVLSPSHSRYDLENIMKRGDMDVSACGMYALAGQQTGKIEENELEYILYDMELPLIRVLYTMESYGFYVSRDDLVALGKKYDAQIADLTRRIHSLAGSEFNISSTKQLAEVLFENLQLPVIKKTKTGYSTDIEVLEKLENKHPIIGLIMEYRMLTKLKSTYVDGLVSLIRDGYIHTTFLQTGTTTGRLSSTEPNLQNIPIRSSMSDDIRRAFHAPEGFTIVSADYSQIELRILAHMADDENMKRAFQNGEDIHARTAAEILDKDIEEVTREERSHAKAVNFGIVYGISDFGLARGTGMSRKRAGEYIQKYFREFTGVRQYMDDIIASARDQGYVRTMFGRIRYLPELSSGNYNIRSAGERFALNTPIQGTAADIMKIAMNRTAKKLEGTASRLVLQIHDELIVYAAKGEEDTVKDILRECMSGAADLSVPLVVDVASGKTWLEAK